jgi:hypothetical protein
MFSRLARTVVKVLVASLIVGTILAHFGISTGELIKTAGLSPDRIEEPAREAFAWALPNLLLGSLVIAPLWFLLFCSGCRARAGIDDDFCYGRTGVPLTTLNLASSEAAMTARPTTPIMMLQTAFISGFTPRRTSE